MKNLLVAAIAVMAFSAPAALAGDTFDLKTECASIAAKYREARAETDDPLHNAHFLSGSVHKAMLEFDLFNALVAPTPPCWCAPRKRRDCCPTDANGREPLTAPCPFCGLKKPVHDPCFAHSAYLLCPFTYGEPP